MSTNGFAQVDGQLYFNVPNLNSGECKLAADLSRRSASSERFKVIADVLSGVAVGVVTIAVAITVASVALPYFLSGVSAFEGLTGVAFHSGVFVVAKGVFYGLDYICALLALRIIWENSSSLIKERWSNAERLENQALQADFRRAGLDKTVTIQPVSQE